MDYLKIVNWAWGVGKRLKEVLGYDDGIKMIERIIFDLRGESTPGRFLEKLAVRIADFNKRFGINVLIPREITERNILGDEFHYLKAAILIGFLNSSIEIINNKN